MTTNERCVVCDLPRATTEQWETMCGGEGADLCWATDGLRCSGKPVDWRARALAAETERDAVGDSVAGLEARYADLLGIAKGLGETGDVMLARMTLAEAERDEARRLLAAALRGELPCCDSCDRYATRVAVNDATKYHSRRETYACDTCFAHVTEGVEDWSDLPHAAMVRAAMEVTQ